MGSFRFLLSRRWVLFALTVVLLVWATIWLGNWQFDRLHQKRHDNAIIRANLHAQPAPVSEVSSGRTVPEDDEWRRVRATGRYDTEDTIIWRYRSDEDGVSGIDVVVPLITQNGTRLLVDRGWMKTEDQTHYPTLPAPPKGEVEVTGWLRQDATGEATSVDRVGGVWGTRAPSSRAIARALGAKTYPGFVQLESEDPAPAHPLRAGEMPDLGEGPHFFYGLQWWFFGVLAVFGFFYLLFDERRSLLRQRTDDEADDRADNRADHRGEAADADHVGDGGSEPREPRRSRRAAKTARKQAVRAAYQAAYAKERESQRAAQRERPTPSSADRARQ